MPAGRASRTTRSASASYTTTATRARLSQRTFAAFVRGAFHAGAPLLLRFAVLSWLQYARDITPYLHFLLPPAE
ncbi:hypothetical protein TRAPUB_7436 [Trametes pubescens]|uniref:Uncharacterized protein n=1 Tax=Trametes pubescens TaxID=154538 RepID=A0A1M2V3E2_TRAPU|nr:hypothetical protein TRAPUB_7436 [Trametes pubescens]